MAQFPCDVGMHRYKGPQRTAYPAVVNGSVSFREKRRLCEEHFDELLDAVASWQDAAELAETTNECNVCHTAGSSWAVFVTAYNLGEDRADWYARCCFGCLRQVVLSALFGPENEVQGRLEV